MVLKDELTTVVEFAPGIPNPLIVVYMVVYSMKVNMEA